MSKTQLKIQKIEGLSDKGASQLREILELQEEGKEIIEKMADIVGKMDLSDIQAISSKNKDWEKMFVNLLAVSKNMLHVGLYGKSYPAANAVKRLSYNDQDRALRDGLPIIRKNDEGKWQINMLKLHEINTEDISVAFEGNKLLDPKQQEYKQSQIEKKKKPVKKRFLNHNGKKLGVYDEVSDLWKPTTTFVVNGCSKEIYLEVGRQNGWIKE